MLKAPNPSSEAPTTLSRALGPLRLTNNYSSGQKHWPHLIQAFPTLPCVPTQPPCGLAVARGNYLIWALTIQALTDTHEFTSRDPQEAMFYEPHFADTATGAQRVRDRSPRPHSRSQWSCDGHPGVRLRRFQNLGLVHSTVYRMPCFINKTVMELQKPGSECSQEKHVNILAP